MEEATKLITSGAGLSVGLIMDKESGLSRRGFLGTFGLGAAGAALYSQVPESAAAMAIGSQQSVGKPHGSPVSKPNLILFLPDELRADALACYGNPVCRTPNLDHLAATGVRFNNCHVQFPVCGASRCCLLTGWPTSVRGHRSLYYFLRPYEPNLFRYLKQDGYDVFWYGKNDALASESFCDSVTEWNYYRQNAKVSLSREPGNPWPVNDPMHYSFLYEACGDRRRTGDYRNVLAAIRILEQKERDRPFCIFLPLTFPHPPYSAPDGFHGMYDPGAIPALRPTGLPKRPAYHEEIRRAYNISSLSEDVFRKIHSVYLGMVSYTDWMLGELLEAVERTGRSKDTAIFAFSDHGEYAGDYGLVEKWTGGLEDALTHVPLIARVPGGATGHIVNEMNEQFDVMATCLELAGVKARHTHFSRSLVPQLRGEAGDPGRAVFAEAGYNTYEPQCFALPQAPGEIYYPKAKLETDLPATVSRASMVRTREHKLVLRPQGQSELYSYKNDPRELNNLYDQASFAAVQHDLERRLAAWYVQSTGIAPWDKDPRGAPQFMPTPALSVKPSQRDFFDKG